MMFLAGVSLESDQSKPYSMQDLADKFEDDSDCSSTDKHHPIQGTETESGAVRDLRQEAMQTHVEQDYDSEYASEDDEEDEELFDSGNSQLCAI